MPTSSRDTPLGEQLKQSSGSYELVLSVAIFSFGGLWLDRRFGTTPWLTILVAVLASVGAVAAQYYRYRDRIGRLEAETAELRRATSKASGERSASGTDRSP